MRRLDGLLVALALFLPAAARPAGPASADDRALSSAVDALWSALSHGPGQGADAGRLRALFDPGARILGVRVEGGRRSLVTRDVAAFVAAQTKPDADGFHEREVHREVRRYGAFAQVFSTVESRRDPAAPAALYTGINSLQLYRDESGWRIVCLYYALEDPADPLPADWR